LSGLRRLLSLGRLRGEGADGRADAQESRGRVASRGGGVASNALRWKLGGIRWLLNLGRNSAVINAATISGDWAVGGEGSADAEKSSARGGGQALGKRARERERERKRERERERRRRQGC
jgi:hypothetical protein